MTKQDYIRIFNAMIRGTPVSWDKEVFPMISEYLTEINYENYPKVIQLIAQRPQEAQLFMPELINYYCKKFSILSIKQLPSPNDLNFTKTILYYE